MRKEQKPDIAMRIAVEIVGISKTNHANPRGSRGDVARIFERYIKGFGAVYVSKSMVYRFRDDLLKRKDPPLAATPIANTAASYPNEVGDKM